MESPAQTVLEAMEVMLASPAMEETGPREMRLHLMAEPAGMEEQSERRALEDLEQAQQAMEPMAQPQPAVVTEAMAGPDFPQ